METKHITTLAMARSGHNFVLQNILSWLDGVYIHHNLESIRPKDLVYNHLKYPGPKVFIWRDFDDWLASSIMHAGRIYARRKSTYELPMYINRIIHMYNTHMEEINNPKYFHADAIVHYDEFVKSRSYRKSMCRLFDGTYSESEINIVPRNGYFSSFDGSDFQGKGSQMNVLNRASDILDTEYKDMYLKLMEEHA